LGATGYDTSYGYGLINTGFAPIAPPSSLSANGGQNEDAGSGVTGISDNGGIAESFENITDNTANGQSLAVLKGLLPLIAVAVPSLLSAALYLFFSRSSKKA
jgi:hypothetical protein